MYKPEEKLTITDKSKILFSLGFLQEHQLHNKEVIERRWIIKQTIPQLSRYDVGAK